MNAAATLAKLQAVLTAHGPLALAVSGGVDSMTLAAVACALLPDTEVFHAISAAVPAAATVRVRQYAVCHGWRLRCIDAGEFADPAYRANPGNRCYYCKANLYGSLHRHTTRVVAAGTNLDDLGDYRPGLKAAQERQVVHPLVEAGMTKQAVRELAAYLGLHELSELPASPCLASRVTTGIAIDADLLPLIDRTEEALRAALQLSGAAADLRCRIRGSGLAIETSVVLSGELDELVRGIAADMFAGTRFTHIAARISIEPYRKGSAFIRVAT